MFHQIENVNKIDDFLEKHKLPKVTQKTIYKLKKKQTGNLHDFTVEIYLYVNTRKEKNLQEQTQND